MFLPFTEIPSITVNQLNFAAALPEIKEIAICDNVFKFNYMYAKKSVEVNILNVNFWILRDNRFPLYNPILLICDREFREIKAVAKFS